MSRREKESVNAEDLESLSHIPRSRYGTEDLAEGLGTRLEEPWLAPLSSTTLSFTSLVPRPLPDFISQPWLRDKIWEWPGDEATVLPHHLKSVV